MIQRPPEPPAAPPHHDEDTRRLVKVVERTWYYAPRPGDCQQEACPPCDGPGYGLTGGSIGPGRPGRPPGVTSGRLGDGPPVMVIGDIRDPRPPGIWVGTRANMDLPYLFMRANPSDLGKRPIVNAPFWESPDIFLLAGVTPSLAPSIPTTFGDTALAGRPNTIYAHIWNFGLAAANEVIVEFYWCNPALGIDSDTAQLIAQVPASLGSRGSGRNHAVVKCPEAWMPTFLNGGHECLVVRVWDNPADVPGEPRFDASTNRHVAQRNIHVVDIAGGSVRALRVPRPGLLALEQPVTIRVGALYGQPAEVSVERVVPSTVPWLQLRTGLRGKFPTQAPATGQLALSPPMSGGGGFPTAVGAMTQPVVGDDQQLAFTTTDSVPEAGAAHVYHVRAHQAGAVFGGYTIILLG